MADQVQAEGERAGGDARTAARHDRAGRASTPGVAEQRRAALVRQHRSCASAGRSAGRRAGCGCREYGRGAARARFPRRVPVEPAGGARVDDLLAPRRQIGEHAAPCRAPAPGRSAAVKRRSRRGRRSRSSSGRPSAFHFGRPPSSSATLSWPNRRSIHQARAGRRQAGAVVDDDAVVVADAEPLHLARRRARATGSCAAGLVPGSAMSSMSKNTAPGMCRGRNPRAPSASRPGSLNEPSTTRTSGSSRCAASHSVQTSASGWA